MSKHCRAQGRGRQCDSVSLPPLCVNPDGRDTRVPADTAPARAQPRAYLPALAHTRIRCAIQRRFLCICNVPNYM
jgi:hypothetical protein